MNDEEADNYQNWAQLTGAVAWHLIDRHAEGWDEVDAMMNAWLRAKIKAANEQPKVTPEGLAEAKKVLGDFPL